MKRAIEYTLKALLVVGITWFAWSHWHQPVHGHFKRTGDMLHATIHPKAFVLPDGEVLLLSANVPKQSNGICCESGNIAELYNYKTGHFYQAELPPYNGQAIQLNNGNVLVYNNYSIGHPLYGKAKDTIYNWRTGHWEETGHTLPNRGIAKPIVLRDGRILIIGGTSGQQAEHHYKDVVFYNPSTGETRRTKEILLGNVARTTPYLLNDGRVLMGSSIFDPNDETFTLIKKPPTGKYPSPIVVLNDGNVLITTSTKNPETHVISNDFYLYNPVSQIYKLIYSQDNDFRSRHYYLLSNELFLVDFEPVPLFAYLNVGSFEYKKRFLLNSYKQVGLFNSKERFLHNIVNRPFKYHDYSIVALPNGDALYAGGQKRGIATTEAYVFSDK